MNPYQPPASLTKISIPKVEIIQWCTIATKNSPRHRILQFRVELDKETAKKLVEEFFVANHAKILVNEDETIEFDRGLIRPPSFTLGSTKPATRIIVKFESQEKSTKITCKYDSQQFNICDQFGGPVIEIRALAKHIAERIPPKPE